MRNGTLGRTYESAPTGGLQIFSAHSGSVGAERYFREGILNRRLNQ